MSAATSSAGLFDAPARPAAATLPVSEPADDYRSLSGAAIAGGVLAVLSPLAFVDWWLLALPVVGMALAGIALRDIARRPDVLAGRRLAMVSVAAAAAMFIGGLTWQVRTYAAELPPGFTRISYALLQPEPGGPMDMIPESAVALDGRDVLLKGYIYPTQRPDGISEFILCRDKGDCCFGGKPKISDRVRVQLADGDAISFSQRLTKVAGRFAVRPVAAPDMGGGVLYHIENARVR